MDTLSDVGISPVLLQAINQTLTSNSAKELTLENASNKRHWKKTLTMDNSDENQTSHADIVSHMLNSGTRFAQQQQQQRQQQQQQQHQRQHQTSSEAVKQMLKMKLEPSLNHRQAINVSNAQQSVKSSSLDVAMASVLSSLAAQSQNSKSVMTISSGLTGQSAVEKVEKRQPVILCYPSGTSGTGGQVISHIPAGTSTKTISFDEAGNQILVRMNPNEAHHGDETAQTQIVVAHDNPIATATTGNHGDGQSRMIVYYQKDQDGNTVQLDSSVMVSGGGDLLQQGGSTMDHSGSKVFIQSRGFQDSEDSKVNILTDDSSMFAVSQDSMQTVDMNTSAGSNAVTFQMDPGGKMPNTPCPVCGDAISGYHYGIFTCESCKGFFKRTVQNKKTFVCHRQGDCEITLENRKKCPACRFAKCLVMGMKLEAIRSDRTRGGRSSYGSSPSGTPSIKTSLPTERKRPRPVQRSESGTSQTYISIPETTQGSSQLVAILNNGNPVTGIDLNVPQILTDIMNLESLLCDDELPSEVSGESFSVTDPSVYLTLLQLTELKLYKIVRWARNLPYFSNISTDDQILLLQNCWCDLLTLTSSWRSIHLNNEILFFHEQSINEEKAKILGMDEVFEKMLFLIEHLRRLRVDQYEMVAMKVVILMSPDMKGLKDADKLKEQQERIAEALEKYTSSHYRQSPNKFGELLLRLPELSRVSALLKEHLMNWMPENAATCGLLFELLKGENMKDLG